MGTERRTAQEGRSDKSWACDLEERRRTSGAKYRILRSIMTCEDEMVVVMSWKVMFAASISFKRVRTLRVFSRVECLGSRAE